jgi:hypothetical protein
VKRALALLLGLTAVLAATAAPAGAGAHGHAGDAPMCWDGGAAHELFGALDKLTTASAAARGGAGKPRDGATTETMVEVPGGQQGVAFAGATIPVWFHVITDGATGNLTVAQLQDQVEILNDTFGGADQNGPGFDTGFRFTYGGATYTDNADWFLNLTPNSPQERAAKSSLRRGEADTLNVWTTDGPGYLGFATFPSSYKEHPERDGIVLDYKSFLGGPFGTNFSLGETATHEAGHWLGLYHTFQGGCNNFGDYVDDTPAMKVPTSGCPVGKDTCTKDPGLDPVHNYMDYSFDSCYTTFSPGQAERMQDQWLFFREGGGFTVKG